MINFLFWNLNNKDLSDNIYNIANCYDIDVLLFAEFDINIIDLLKSLKSKNKLYFYAPSIGCDRVHIFLKFDPKFLQIKFETERLSIRHLKLPGLIDILLVINHFPSKYYFSDPSQSDECVVLSDYILEEEEKVGHKRTILVGDLNMNPFEDGVVSTRGLNSVMSRNIANKQNRTVQGNKYPYFYNPMWNFFGDHTHGPPGTYYYSRAEHKVIFWNIFDQVMIRPGLLDNFDTGNVQILSSDGKNSLINSDGVPDKKLSSDHLPIFFQLSL